MSKKELSDKVRERKRQLKKQEDDLEITKKRDSRLRMILEDWNPQHIIDKIAIAESDGLVVKVDNIIKTKMSKSRKLIKCLRN
ncbi:MAG: hypothetical protein ABUM51_00315 [Bacteroidota bacterium]